MTSTAPASTRLRVPAFPSLPGAHRPRCSAVALRGSSGARTLFESLNRLRALPEHLEVLPGAVAGSVCGRGLSRKPNSTIGFERRYNAAFGIAEAERFVAFMLENIPPAPPKAAELRATNAGLPSGEAA